MGRGGRQSVNHRLDKRLVQLAAANACTDENHQCRPALRRRGAAAAAGAPDVVTRGGRAIAATGALPKSFARAARCPLPPRWWRVQLRAA